ncbi:MAG: cytochrome c [Bacteroidetes bacterium]|nr:cytochrome c [Bacteroidota bacterium]
MKGLFCVSAGISSIFLINSCGQTTTPDNKQAEIDSLKTVIAELKPGLGEFMLQIKYHHDSLGKAINQKDYDRAAYEVDELKETTEKIQQLNITNDKLQKPFPIFFDKYLQGPLNTLADAAAKKDEASLKTNFISLTENCNSCHHENNMGFMKIVP